MPAQEGDLHEHFHVLIHRHPPRSFEGRLAVASRRHRRGQRHRRRVLGRIPALECRLRSAERAAQAAAARAPGSARRARGSSRVFSAASSSASRAPRCTPSSSPPSSRRSWATSGDRSRSSRGSSRDWAPRSSSCVFAYAVWRLPVAILAGAGAGLACGINDRILWYAGADTTFTIVYIVSHDDLGRRHRRRRLVVRRARTRGHRRAEPVRLGPRSHPARLGGRRPRERTRDGAP